MWKHLMKNKITQLRLGLGMGFRTIDKSIEKSIETYTFYLNAYNHNLIDVARLTDTRYGHMVILTKSTGYCVTTVDLQICP